MSVGRLPPFVRGKLNKAECGPTSCGVRQMSIAQLHEVGVPKEKKYSLAEATEIHLHNIWRNKAMQITALSGGMYGNLSKILENEIQHGGEQPVHSTLLDLYSGNNGPLWDKTGEYLTNAISKAEFGTLDKVKDHPERYKAASEAARAFVNSLAMALR